jgi:hypothetical protein
MRALLLLLLASLAAGCNYGFTGGGLPGHIRTVAILAFENSTSQPLLETDIQRALQVELPRSLGVRIADESVADALVRGTVSSYDEVVSSVRPTPGGAQNDQVPVVQRQVHIVFNAEIYDLRQDQVIWRAQSQSVLGTFAENESQDTGRTRAIEELVNRFVEGAQSQW